MQCNIAHDLEAKERTKDVILEENIDFASLLLPDDIKRGLTASGFKKPSPIQFKAVPLGRCGFDLIVKSKSGTGKTLVFSITALETINVTKNHPQVLILVPTREIAVQIQDVLCNVGTHINGLVVESFIGGRPLEDDLKKCSKCHIAVGAPGRVKHLIKVGSLPTNSIRLFVLDEADKLMEDSFQSDINEIFNALPLRKQMIVTSATYPQELDTFLANYMLSPTHVTSENETPLLLGLKQFVSVLSPGNAVQQMKIKNDLLLQILSKVSFTQCLVFTNYQSRTESVSNYLNQKGWASIFISAAQKQSKRLEAIHNLKNFKYRILLSTDLTSRGIDAPNVDLVVNYDLPIDAVTYLHRMGRAGRYGSSGICINFASEGPEVGNLQKILGTIGSSNLSIAKLPVLNGVDLWQVDPRELEQIWGVVPEDTAKEISEGLKKEVLDLKQSKKKVKSEKKLKGNSDDEVKKRKKETKNEEIQKEGTKEEDDEGKKRKRDNLNEASPELQQEKRKNDNSDTFTKNKALLNLAKILCDPTADISSDLIESISEYKILEEINSDVSEDRLEVNVAPKEEIVEDVLEEIFKIGYECALGSENKTFLNYLPLEEVQSYQDFCREEELAVATVKNELLDEEEEEEEEYEEENDLEMQEAVSEEIKQNNLEWIPVETQSDSSREKHFTQCFEDCSGILWQQGLTFETVENFDDWFYQWQGYLQSVRNYVQQNIYIEEMSKYQESRRRSDK